MKFLYIWFTVCCISPFFWDRPRTIEQEPEPITESAGYICDCGWRELRMWHDVTASPFTYRLQNQPF